MNSTEIKKHVGQNNPIIAARFMADPYAISYEGRVYVYGSNDSGSLYKDEAGVYEKNSYANIKGLNCISSDDLVNWVDHGIIQIADDPRSGRKGVAKWAGNSWAPAACYKEVNGKKQFFLYFANSASSIGVLVSDSPVGPWVDPLGTPMITRETPGCENVEWLFDPAVLVDEDGSAYLYFGGGVPQGKEVNPQTARVAKLSEDMIHLDGVAKLIDAPYLFEDSGINKINGTYYYSYCSNWSQEAADAMGRAQISYMTSKEPMGPFEYQGEIMKNPGQSENFGQEAWGNNHHCMLQIDDVLYMFYHTPQYEIDMKFDFEVCNDKCAYRTTYLDVATVNSDGTIVVKDMTKTGTASQLKNVNPYTKNREVAFVWAEGVTTELFEKSMCVKSLKAESWIGISKVDFGAGELKSLEVEMFSELEDKGINIYIDSIDQRNKIATLSINKSKTDVQDVTGVHDLFIEFTDANICLFDWKAN